MQINSQPSHHSQIEQDKLSSISSSSNSDVLSSHLELKIKSAITKNIKIRYTLKKIYKCCKKCKHTDKDKKACVCVVPLGQRRTQLGPNGCQNCGCKGCSREDFISRGQDPQYHPKENKKQSIDQQQLFEARNGCCRPCMKAFSRSNKSCLCQVPLEVRKSRLPPNGCKICGCLGCNPEDKRERGQQNHSRSRSKTYNQRRRQRWQQSSESREVIDSEQMNFYGIDKSIIGSMIINQYHLVPYMLGFGIPQRTHSYIFGKPK